MARYDLVLRDAYVDDRDAEVDIGVADGRIETVADRVDGAGEREIPVGGDLVAPGFVDAHMHVDKSFAACGDRRPRGNEGAFDFGRIHALEADYFAEASPEQITRNALRDIQLAVAAGTTHIRTHVAVDGETFGLQNVRAVVEAAERASEIVDVQIVPMARNVLDDDGEAALREAVELGLSGLSFPGAEPALVGGSDPASAHHDVEGTLATWFAVARDLDVGIDLHVHDGGTLGTYTLERLIAHADRAGYDGRVTASHSYALANVRDWRVEELLEALADVDVRLVTCYQSTRPEMPVRRILDSPVTLGHGTDNDRDFVFPHGNADPLEGALIESNKLHGDRAYVSDYRWFDSNEGLAALWGMITRESARVLGIEGYGIREGTPADLAVFDAPSPQWAIVTGADRRYVLKDGTVVVEDGDLRPEHTLVEGYRDVLDDGRR